jgi:hypothetical protein
MTIETSTEKLDNIEEADPLTQDLTKPATLPQEDRIRSIIAERFSKLEKIKPEIPPKTYQLVYTKIKFEEESLLAQFKKEAEQKAEREKVTQSLPKSYFEQKFLRVKEIRID